MDRDLYLMDEKWMPEYDAALTKMLAGGGYEAVGYISYAAARNVSQYAIDLSWYPNIHTRFHELRISLPRDQFVCCVSCWRHDEKPRIFVKGSWLDNLHLRSYSIFALIDAIDVTIALQRRDLTREKLLTLREGVDAIAERYRDISFISFADSLLLKSNWSVGQFDSQVRYTYEPEIFIRLIAELQAIYRSVLGLNIYAILTQGSNEYYDDALLHISSTRNHISLNSLGLPFAQLRAIEDAVRKAIRNGEHPRSELYMDENFFRSLSMAHSFKREECPTGAYRTRLMTEDSSYYIASCSQILDNMREAAPLQ